MRSTPFSALQANMIVTGSTEALIDAFFGPRQHDAHMVEYRWHCYTTGNYHRPMPWSDKIVYGARA